MGERGLALTNQPVFTVQEVKRKKILSTLISLMKVLSIRIPVSRQCIARPKKLWNRKTTFKQYYVYPALPGI